jgi:tetratricopeptide (TPR) repeat protein
MNPSPEPTKPLGVSLHYLKRFLDDKRLRRPLHKLGRPNANIETMKVPSLRALSKILRLFSNQLPNQEFSMYENESIKRDAWVKSLKSVPTTSTHILECIIRQQIHTFKQNHPGNESKYSFVDLILHNEQDKGIATDYVSHCHHHRFKDVVEALENHENHLDELWEYQAPRPTRYYYIDIFCEEPPPSYRHHQQHHVPTNGTAGSSHDNDDDNEDDNDEEFYMNYYNVDIINLMVSIDSVLLILGPMNSMHDIIHKTVTGTTTVTTATTTTVITPRGTATTTNIQPLSTYTTKVVWEVYLASLYSKHFNVCLQTKLLDDGDGGFDSLLLSSEMNIVIEAFIESVIKPASSCTTTGGNLLINDTVNKILRTLINGQWDGGEDTVYRVCKATISRWLLDRSYQTCVKWHLVEPDEMEMNKEEILLVGSLRRRRRKSIRPPSSHASRNGSHQGNRSRSGSRSGSRSSSKSRPSSPSTTTSRPSSSSKGNRKNKKTDLARKEKIEEDPVYPIMVLLAKNLIDQHEEQQKQKILGIVFSEFHSINDHYSNSVELRRSFKLLNEVYDERENIYGVEHVFTKDVNLFISRVLHLQGKFVESEQRYRTYVFGWIPPTPKRNAVTNIEAHQLIEKPEVNDDAIIAAAKKKEKEERRMTVEDEMELLTQLSLTDPRNIKCLTQFGKLLTDLKQYSLAEECFKRAITGISQLKGKTSNEALNAKELLGKCLLRRRKGKGIDEYRDIVYIRQANVDIASSQRNTTNNQWGIHENGNRNVTSANTMAKDNKKLFDAQHELGKILISSSAATANTAAALEEAEEEEEGKKHALMEGIKVLTKACKGRKKYLGFTHRHYLTSCHLLAIGLHKMKYYDDSIELLKFVLAQRDSTLGPMHLDSLRSAELLGKVVLKRLEKRGDNSELEMEVIECMKSILNQIIGTEGEEEEQQQHSHTEEAEKERIKDAREEREEVMSLIVQNQDTATLINDEALIEAMFRRSVQGFSDVIGENHPKTLSCLSLLGNYLHSISNPLLNDQHAHDYDDESENILRDLLKKRINVLGQSHKDTLQTMNDLATNLIMRNKNNNRMIQPTRFPSSSSMKTNENKESKQNTKILKTLQESEDLFRQVLQGREALLGKDH